MKEIVIIEDDESVIKLYERQLRILGNEKGTEFTALFLTTLDEAEEFLANQLPNRNDIEAITFDGSMIASRNQLDTLHLVRLAKEANFKGIMMASSSCNQYRNKLLEAGCTHKASSKVEMIAELLELLE